MLVGGALGEHKGMNLPHTPLSAPCLTEKDLEDLRFGIGAGVDYVGLSFVRRASDIEDLRRAAKAAGRDVPVIAKIERIEAVENLEEIVAAADGVMVARGDLGVETSAAEIPILQKQILSVAGRRGKPDITATQMLETMVSNPQPSRAEATDIANAVFDGTGALMLSAETAVGKYPVEAVRMMSEIALTAERHLSEYRAAVRAREGGRAARHRRGQHARRVRGGAGTRRGGHRGLHALRADGAARLGAAAVGAGAGVHAVGRDVPPAGAGVGRAADALGNGRRPRGAGRDDRARRPRLRALSGRATWSSCWSARRRSRARRT